MKISLQPCSLAIRNAIRLQLSRLVEIHNQQIQLAIQLLPFYAEIQKAHS